MSRETILRVQGLTASFKTEEGRVRAVDGADFDLRRGETLGIVGESGCGKSVTAHSIMRLLPRPSGTIDKGRILFEGRDLLSLPIEAMQSIRGRRIAMIFQEPMTALNPVHKIGRQLREVQDLHLAVMTRREKLDAALEILERVGIADSRQVLEKYPHHLSGGMRQRVMIAMALLAKPAILIADEPTTALDVTVQAQILELIHGMQDLYEMSVILITHDLGVIAENCDRAVVMYGGQVAEKAPVVTLFQKPVHPYTRGLLASIPSLAAEPKTMLPTIPGMVPSLEDMPKGCRFSTRCSRVMEICGRQSPQATMVGEGHTVRCHLLKGCNNG